MLFKEKALKAKQEELKEMAVIEHLEELGKVNVSDLEMEDVSELQKVLESLNYITEYEDDYLVFMNEEEKRQYRINEVKRTLLKNKGGSGGITYRVSIPVDFIREVDMEDANEVTLSINYEEESIVIRKDE